MAVTEGYLRTLDAHGVAPAVMQPTLRKRAIEVASTLQQQSSNCLCHNDVHALNIVDNGTLRLIDWEYAGQGERFFDLASVCIYHSYEREQRERLLLGYAGTLRQSDLASARAVLLAVRLHPRVVDGGARVGG